MRITIIILRIVFLECTVAIISVVPNKE